VSIVAGGSAPPPSVVGGSVGPPVTLAGGVSPGSNKDEGGPPVTLAGGVSPGSNKDEGGPPVTLAGGVSPGSNKDEGGPPVTLAGGVVTVAVPVFVCWAIADGAAANKTLATIISDRDSTNAFPVNDDDSLWDVVVISF
jgi:hypothetical protein